MSAPLASPVPFPDTLPAGVSAIADDPLLDPATHLALTKPDRVPSLSELGYSEADQAACPTGFAVSGAFRRLSAEGVATLQHVCLQLEDHVFSCNRIERIMRGGVYRSSFVRSLCLSPEVAEFISGLCGARVVPHGMPHQLGHLNFQPLELGRNVDKWHHDTLAIPACWPPSCAKPSQSWNPPSNRLKGTT